LLYSVTIDTGPNSSVVSS
jgi:hypothetical protein